MVDSTAPSKDDKVITSPQKEVPDTQTTPPVEPQSNEILDEFRAQKKKFKQLKKQQVKGRQDREAQVRRCYACLFR